MLQCTNQHPLQTLDLYSTPDYSTVGAVAGPLVVVELVKVW